VKQEGPAKEAGLPPVLGTYSLGSQEIRFEPAYPLDPGVRYVARFHPDRLPGRTTARGEPVASEFQVPERHLAPTTVVREVYPTARLLPENLLKFYIEFSAPMSGGHIYEHIHLRNDQGRDVELPFLEINEELWNPAMTRLTLFIDPGRIKRGVRPLEEVGPVLENGKSYTLVIDEGWRDANGAPLKRTFQKIFEAGPPDRDPPDPVGWKIQSPRSGGVEALSIVFPEPMDYALARRVIRVINRSGEVLDGIAVLGSEERRWSFQPARAWERGPYTLSVQTTIEDLAGNNIGKPFDVDLFEGVQRQFTNTVVNLPFEIR
jgi:hypothetical protein